MPSLNVLFGSHAHRVSRTLGARLLLALVSGMALAPAYGQPFPAGMCAADRRGSDLGCTSNDIDIADVTVNNGVTSCVAGSSVTLDLSLTLLLNASNRYDIGVFVALDGKSPIILSSEGGSASCSVFGVPTSPPPLANLDGNACGDVGNAVAFGSAVVTTIHLGTVTVPCTPDAAGRLVLPATVTWDNNGSSTSCQAPPAEWVQASTKSNCSAGIAARIPVTVTGRITVVKDTTPSGSPGSFAFNASGPAVSPAAFSLAAGQQQVLDTAQLTTTPQVYTVTEQAAAGFDLSSLQCISDLDHQTHPEFVAVDLSTRTATIRMSSNPTLGLTSATCFFHNTRPSSITVVKKTLGGDATFQFSGPSPFAITTQGGTGQRVFPNLTPGTYTVSEVVPPGWIRSDTVCADPTGDTTVVGGTATIKLGAGEDVTCTYTDTKLGAIQVNKSTVGGDGTFTFTGPQNFQITTTSGAGGFALPNLAPGTYTISESVPADWLLSGIVCTDPTNDSTTSGSTATINIAPGEIVACTFTNTKQASVTVEKQTLGGDGTFAFTGSQSFSITTTTGNGKNTTAFASVVPGVALSIVESVPSGWTLEKAACRDPASGKPLGAAIANGVSVTPAAGQAILCTFADTKGATLRVFKNAVPQSAQSFDYTLTGPTAPTFFSLVDSGSGANSKTFTDLPAGDYTVTELSVPGWINTGITCSDVVEPDLERRTTVNRAAPSFTAQLRFGQTVDCTFTNTQIQPGIITVHKKAVGGDGAFDFVGTGPGVVTPFTIITSGAEHAGSQSFAGLAAGTYTVSETVPAGWDLAPLPIACTVTSGSSTTITPNGLNGVTIALGTTGAATDSVACEFVDIKRGSITIAKSASPQDPQPFTFTTASLASTTSLPGSFQIADSGTPPNSRTFDTLVPTIYTVTEASVAGWRLVDVACTGGSVVTADRATGTAVIDLQPGEDVVCTYSNAKNGTITVTKSALGAAGGDAFTFAGDLAGTISTGQSLSGSFADGSYAISEIVPAGWDLANIVCTGGSVTYTGQGGSNPTPSFAPGDTTINVTIAGAQGVACMFTNVKHGSISIVKNAQGGDASFDFTGARSFQIVTNGGTGENTTAFASVAPGTYAVTEVIPAGWRLAGLACTNASPVDLAAATALVNVAPGENVMCTFTDAREGSITISKRIRSGLSGAFTFTVPTTLDPSGTFTLTPAARTVSASRVFSNVLPGSYTITESALPAGWSLEGITCAGANSSVDLPGRSTTIDLAVGQAAECIFDNSELGAITISALSVGGTGTFGFTGSGSPGTFRTVVEFSVTTTQDTTKAGETFGSLPPGNASVVGQGAPGWELDSVSCLSNTAGTSWVIAGTTVTLALSQGDAIECIYYYRLPSAIIVPPTIAKAFGAASIVVNGTTTLTFTLTNPNAGTALSGVGFIDNLPAGLVVATPNGLTGSCGGGAVTAVAGTGSVGLANGSLPASGSCTITVSVTGATAGAKNNTTNAVTSTEGGTGGTASANLTVVALPVVVPPTIAKAFGAASIAVNGTTTLTFTLTNPNAGTALTGVGFTDNLPAGLMVGNPNGLTSTCGGTVTAVAGTGSVALANGGLPASGSCTITLNVTGATAGAKNNTTSAVTSTEGGTGGTASASLTVVAPQTIAKAFGTPIMLLNGTTTLRFTLNNPNAGADLTGVRFTDNLPAGLVVGTPSGLISTCGGTVIAVAGAGSVALLNGGLSAGGRCTIRVNITSTTTGVKNNTTSAVISNEGGTGGTASANIAVVPPTTVVPPTIDKDFGVSTIIENGTTTLTFTLTNPNPVVPLTGVSFTDPLPGGLVVGTPNGLTGSCGGGTITATAGATTVDLAGATLAGGTSCVFAIVVRAVAAGSQVNTTSAVMSTNGGVGGAATASITVLPLASIPTLSTFALAVLAIVLLLSGLRRKTAR